MQNDHWNLLEEGQLFTNVESSFRLWSWLVQKWYFKGSLFFESKIVWNGITVYLWIVLNKYSSDSLRERKSNFVVISKLTFKAFWDSEKAGDFLPLHLNDLTFVQKLFPGVGLLFHYSNVSFYNWESVYRHMIRVTQNYLLSFTFPAKIDLNPPLSKFHCIFQ